MSTIAKHSEAQCTALKPQAQPAALVNPARPDESVFTFSFSSGRHATIRRTLDRLETVLSRTVYRPFMRFQPVSVDHVVLQVPSLANDLDSFHAVQISDIHHSQIVPLRVVDEAVRVANGLSPQAVFLTGDFVSNDASYAAACAKALGQLRAPLGVYAILGNHDYWTDPLEITRCLIDNGIVMLINTARQLSGNLWLAGLDDAWSGQPDIDKALEDIPAGSATIVLAHEPDVADRLQGQGLALQLSGHSHGGQVRLPFTDRPVLPFLAWKYYAHLHCVGDLPVYTSAGLGTIQPPFIFNCRPQITSLLLRRE
jgi:uncharacterized protein